MDKIDSNYIIQRKLNVTKGPTSVGWQPGHFGAIAAATVTLGLELDEKKLHTRKRALPLAQRNRQFLATDEKNPAIQ